MTMTGPADPHQPGLSGSAQPVDVYDLALLDLDGVVYVGPDAVPGAAEAVANARAAGLHVAFVTNNASRPPDTVASHLTELGIQTGPDDVVNSAQAAATLLSRRLPAGSAVLVVGGEGLYRALEAVGLRPVASMDDEPRAVVQGFSPDVGWRLLAEGTRAVRAGLPWMATNTDLTVPTPYGPAPGNGALVGVIRTATGVTPEVAGKPQPPLFREAVQRYGSRCPLVVGDRLDTDLEGARNAGLPGLLVLTGVTGVAELLAADPGQRPHLLARDLRGLFEEHPAPEQADGAWRCRDAEVRLDNGRLDVINTGDNALDLLRAATAAVWATSDGTAPNEIAQQLAEQLDAMDPSGPWRR